MNDFQAAGGIPVNDIDFVYFDEFYEKYPWETLYFCEIFHYNDAVFGREGGDTVGEVIAVLSGKGGTGKTSVCAGIALALADAGGDILCIDCDVGLRNLDIALGMSQVGALSFADVASGNYSLDNAARHPDFPKLRFLTAPVNCSPGEIETPAFRDLLSEAKQRFHYIFLDAPAGIDAGFALSARYADRVLLVTGPDPAAVRDATRTGELLELMDKKDVRLVVNRLVPKLISAMSVTVDDIMDKAGLPLIGVVPEDYNVTLAAAFGQPIFLQTKRGAAAAFRRIAKRIRGMNVPIRLA